MCGIIGCVGREKNVVPILIEGLKGGVSAATTPRASRSSVTASWACGRSTGRSTGSSALLESEPVSGPTGIAHTRWATHGEPSRSTPTLSSTARGRIAVVHNGIVENYRALRRSLEAEGHVFESETDTEVLAHLIEELLRRGISKRPCARRSRGSREPTASRSFTPTSRRCSSARGTAVLSWSGSGTDATSLPPTSPRSSGTRGTSSTWTTSRWSSRRPTDSRRRRSRTSSITKDVEKVTWNIDTIEKNGFPHFMLKEIFEQERTVHGRRPGPADRGGGRRVPRRAAGAPAQRSTTASRIIIIACGTSWHAGLIGEYMIEDLARVSVEVEYASEFRYRNPVIEPGRHRASSSASPGETTDTLAAMSEAQRRGAIALGHRQRRRVDDRAPERRRRLHRTPVPRSAWRRRRRSRRSSWSWPRIALTLGRRARASRSTEGREIVRAMQAIPGQIGEILARTSADRGDRARVREALELPLPRPRVQLPGRARGRAQAQGDLLHPRGGLPGGGDEARSHRADRREHARRRSSRRRTPFYEKILSNMEEVKARGGRDHRRHVARATTTSRRWPTTSSRSPERCRI